MDDFITLNPIDECAKMEINRITRNEVILRHGHIAITNYRLGDNEAFEKSLSKWDAMYYRYVMMGGYYVKRLREFRINRGYDLNRLKYYFPKHYYRIDNDAYPSDNLDVKLLVPPRDDFQKVAITFMACQGEYKENLYFTQQMIDMPTGKGKAQPDDTLIPTPTGWKRLDELKVGDEVFNWNGDPVPILGIYPQYGLQKTYEVVFSDGRRTRCNPEHLWEVYQLDNGDPIVVSAEELLQNMIDGHAYYVRLPEMVRYPNHDEMLHGKVLIITSIRLVRPTFQRCILIDDPRHVYLTEQYIPTHNTYLGTASAAVWSGGCVVFIPIGKLLPQWRDSFLEYTSFTKNEIMIVKGSDKCEKIRKGEYPDTKVFLFSTETFNSYHDRYGDLKTIEMLKKTRAHIKIVDEVHRNMGICSKIEALSNFHINYYMSASPGRADRKEDRIFELSYLNIPKFGSDFMRESEKHINIIIKKYDFEPTNDQIRLMYNPKVGLNGRSYEKVLTTAPMIQRESFDQSLRVMFNWSKSLLVAGNKILVLTNTIAGTEYVKRIAEEFFPGEAESYYSSKNKDEKEEALNKTVIIATEGSLGTGADIKGIQHVYNIITYSNKIGAVQYPGRGRQMNDGTPIIYVEFVNMTYRKTYNQYLARKPYLVEVAKDRKIRVVS